MKLKNSAIEVHASTSDRLKDLMMDLLSTTIEVDPQRLDILSSQDWEAMSQFVEDHRIGPMLHWRINQSRKNLTFSEVFLVDSQSQRLKVQEKTSKRPWKPFIGLDSLEGPGRCAFLYQSVTE